MGSGLVVNNLSTGGQVYKLKDGVSVDQAYQKGLKDGLDQVYFTAGKDKYVLQGDDLKLGELTQVMKSGVPSVLVKLNNQPTEVFIEKIDDNVSTVKDGFVKNGKIASVSGTTATVGASVFAFSGISALVAYASGNVTAKAVTKFGIYGGLVATVAGVGGLLYYTGKSVAQGASNKPNPAQTEALKGEKVNTDNSAKPAGLISVQAKKEAAEGVVTDIVVNSALDIIFNN
jgi:hypothetical protein